MKEDGRSPEFNNEVKKRIAALEAGEMGKLDDKLTANLDAMSVANEMIQNNTLKDVSKTRIVQSRAFDDDMNFRNQVDKIQQVHKIDKIEEKIRGAAALGREDTLEEQKEAEIGQL